MKTVLKNLKSGIPLKSFLLRFAIFALGWLILTGGQQISDIWFVILSLLATTVISIYSVPPDNGLSVLWESSGFFPIFS
jgi:hypothetical protein